MFDSYPAKKKTRWRLQISLMIRNCVTLRSGILTGIRNNCNVKQNTNKSFCGYRVFIPWTSACECLNRKCTFIYCVNGRVNGFCVYVYVMFSRFCVHVYLFRVAGDNAYNTASDRMIRERWYIKDWDANRTGNTQRETRAESTRYPRNIECPRYTECTERAKLRERKERH